MEHRMLATARYVVRPTYGVVGLYNILDTYQSTPHQPYYVAYGIGHQAAMIECLQLHSELSHVEETTE